MGVIHKLIFHLSQIALWCALRLALLPADCGSDIFKVSCEVH